jgi:hypothetical protein
MRVSLKLLISSLSQPTGEEPAAFQLTKLTTLITSEQCLHTLTL